jgi:hypothetical protein
VVDSAKTAQNSLDQMCKRLSASKTDAILITEKLSWLMELAWSVSHTLNLELLAKVVCIHNAHLTEEERELDTVEIVKTVQIIKEPLISKFSVKNQFAPQAGDLLEKLIVRNALNITLFPTPNTAASIQIVDQEVSLPDKEPAHHVETTKESLMMLKDAEDQNAQVEEK